MNDGKEEHDWVKIKAPRPWRPEAGEILEGVYIGKVDAEGQFGPYTKHMVLDELTRETYSISGARIDSLVMAAALQPGATIKVVFLGVKESADGERTYKDFELYKRIG